MAAFLLGFFEHCSGGRMYGLWTTLRQEKNRFGLPDLFILIGIILIFWLVGSIGRDMAVPFSESSMPKISLDYRYLPYYTARSTLRMFIAYGFSLLFTLIVGYAAAHGKKARALILPALDILQSVPVLGFLSATVTGFMALFPGSLLGVEMASLFAIFTGQVWNMTFAFYHSLVTVPKDLDEAASVFGLNAWQKFKTVELPSAAIPLIWNSMMSFGGGWFFVVQSEAISVLNQQITLPGLGSYMSLAIAHGDTKAAVLAILSMVFVVISVDQLLWRPVVAWSQKFRMEQTEGSLAPTSWALDLFRKSNLLRSLLQASGKALTASVDFIMNNAFSKIEPTFRKHPSQKRVFEKLGLLAFISAIVFIIYESVLLVREIRTGLNLQQIQQIAFLGLLTMGRVFVMVVVATLIWTPIGVWIGFRPKVARIAQPLAQVAASFPVNMTFPFVVGFFVATNISINWGSILLIALGTQWYILFNVIAGASSIPTDLKESAEVFGLKGWRYWKTLIIPGIFPYWVTGACTAAGGAWNASIVAEFATWGKQKLIADGLGAFIAEVTEKGDWPAIFCSIAVMSIFVVIINKLLWRNLYDLAEKKFRLD